MGQRQHLKNRRNYYRILHVQPDAPIEVIKASYRTLMGKLGCHPDLGGTHRLATLVNDAYHTLSNSKKRLEYNVLLSLRQRKNREPLSGAFKKKRTPNPHPQTKSNRNTYRRCLVCKKFACEKQHSKHSKAERRDIGRVKQQGPVSYTFLHSENRYQGEFIDLSPEGMQFISKEKVDPMTYIKVRCGLLFGAARVINCHEVLRGDERMHIICLNFVKVEFERSRGTFLSVKG